MKRVATLTLIAMVVMLVLPGCGAPATPQVIEKQVEKVVTQVVEKQVVQTQVVTQIQTQVVEKQVQVTAAPSPTPVPQVISGFQTNDPNEAKTEQAAWDAADKGKPDPAWKGKKFTIGVFASGQHGAISGPTYFWRPKFEELTGASYDIVEIPFAELKEKIYTDFQTGAHKYDVIINCSNWYGDAIDNDWIQPIDQLVNDPRMPKWDQASISPLVANL